MKSDIIKIILAGIIAIVLVVVVCGPASAQQVEKVYNTGYDFWSELNYAEKRFVVIGWLGGYEQAIIVMEKLMPSTRELGGEIDVRKLMIEKIIKSTNAFYKNPKAKEWPVGSALGLVTLRLMNNPNTRFDRRDLRSF